MKKFIITMMILSATSLNIVFGQKVKQDSTEKKFFIGSTFFLLGNFASSNKPDFAQLNLGYCITPKDVVSVELKTWKYAWPLGIPYGDSNEAPGEGYPGYIREFGVGMVYQRFLWKGLYTSIDIMPTYQKYVDENNKKIQNGFQLFNTYRLGYHLSFWKDRLFFEPSVAVTHWPINTNVPELFKQVEDKWPNYFLFEPGLHFGVKF